MRHFFHTSLLSDHALIPNCRCGDACNAGGVFAERGYDPIPNHVVTVVGWGIEEDPEHGEVGYWIIRNSW